MISLPVSIHSQIFWNLIDLAVINNPPEQSICSFGNQITHGDLNGDGFSDLIVASKAEYPGRVYVYFGGSAFDTIFDLQFMNPLTFGHGVACADVNNDGYDDILISNTCTKVWLYYGGTSMDTIADWIASSQEFSSGFGYSIALSDVNSDSFADIIVGAPLAGGLDNKGAVYIYWGSDSPDTICDVKFYGADDSNFGWKLTSNYDVNGDNINDLAVGAPTAPSNFPSISIFYGGEGANFDTICDVEIYNPCGELEYGSSCPLVKDLNGDGFDDLAAGANYHNQVYIYYGGNPMNNQFDVILSADTFRFGMTVVGIDNADGDNYGDIVVGNPRYGGEYPYKGRVYLFRGGNPLDSIYDASVQGFPSQEIGWNVGFAGDLDNDGKDEIAFSNEVASFYPHKVWVVKYSAFEIEEEKDIKNKQINIFQPYPNPFIRSTNVRVVLPHHSYGIAKCFIEIFDLSGRLVRKKQFANYVSPILNYRWDGKDESGNEVCNGVYLIKFRIHGKNSIYEEIRKVTKLR